MDQVQESDVGRFGASVCADQISFKLKAFFFFFLSLVLLSPTSYQLESSLARSFSLCRMLLKNANALGMLKILSHSHLSVNWLEKVAFLKAPKRNKGYQVCWG